MLMPAPEPLTRTKPPPDPLRAHDLAPIPVPKPSPPALKVGTQPEVTSPLVAEPSSASLLPSPSEPTAMHLSAIALPPPQEVCVTQPKQGPPFGRTRTPRKVRNSGGNSSPELPMFDAPIPPHDQPLGRTFAQGSKKRGGQCVGRQSSQPRDARREIGPTTQQRGGRRQDGRPCQPRGGDREKGKHSETRDGHREESSRQDGGRRRSPQQWHDWSQQRNEWRRGNSRAGEGHKYDLAISTHLQVFFPASGFPSPVW